MRAVCDVAIIGAGPYGLSLSAHLSAAGVSHRIFGKPLDTWRHHMPKDMMLKSDGFASNLSAPSPDSTLKAYCAARGLTYHDTDLPVRLEVFNEYATWFQRRFVANLEAVHVARIEREAQHFAVWLETGERFSAKAVVMVPGVTWFAHTPKALKALPNWALSHSYDHRDAAQFKGRRVAVVGGGSSAIDLAASLQAAGADVDLIARADELQFHSAPDGGDSSLLKQLQRPASGIGPGWRSFLCAGAPLLFHRMPEPFRLRVTRRHLGPAAGWFMRARVEGKLPALLGREVVAADAADGIVALTLKDREGRMKSLCYDHVIAATGYRPDLSRLPFLPKSLSRLIAAVNDTPVLSDNFETSVPGLYATGPIAANAFGPLMRFMVGAEFAAPRLAAHLKRKFGARASAQAA